MSSHPTCCMYCGYYPDVKNYLVLEDSIELLMKCGRCMKESVYSTHVISRAVAWPDSYPEWNEVPGNA